KDDQPGNEHPPPPEQIGQPPPEQQQPAEGEPRHRANQHQITAAKPKLILNRGQGEQNNGDGPQ
ncbi:MAG: hypothetical protein K0Q71_4306, partial [Thermomicrobiales bacterium]|nr:hypothetical protein [Thermomicrobiales bacterium]